MSLNIKNERVHDLVREAARMTGKSQTAVIEEAVEHLLESLGAGADRELRRRRLEALFEDWDRNPLTEEERRAMGAVEEDLYDSETGLPA